MDVLPWCHQGGAHQLPWKSNHVSDGNGTWVLWKGSQVFLNAEVFSQSLSPQLMVLSYRFPKSLFLNFTYRISAKEKRMQYLKKHTEELFVRIRVKMSCLLPQAALVSTSVHFNTFYLYSSQISSKLY